MANSRDMEIALYYTDGDENTAQSMIKGAYKDQYAIKGSFSSSAKYGAFILFYHVGHQMFSPMYLLVSQSFTAGELDTTVSWIEFEKSLHELFPESYNAGDLVNSSINSRFNTELKKYFESDDVMIINFRFKKMLEQKLGIQQISLTLDIEAVSSLDVQKFSSTAPKIDLDEILAKRSEGLASAKGGPLAGKYVRLLLRGTLILSPINGKKISLLTVGDKVSISIVDKHPEALEFAKAAKIYNEEGKTIKHITGRIEAIAYSKQKGFEIYAMVGKGIYIYITEEEGDIKVAVENKQTLAKGESNKPKQRSLPLIIASFVAGVFVLACVLFLIFY